MLSLDVARLSAGFPAAGFPAAVLDRLLVFSLLLFRRSAKTKVFATLLTASNADQDAALWKTAKLRGQKFVVRRLLP